MGPVKQSEIDQRVFDLYDEYCHGRIDRREFLARAGTLGAVRGGGGNRLGAPDQGGQGEALRNQWPRARAARLRAEPGRLGGLLRHAGDRLVHRANHGSSPALLPRLSCFVLAAAQPARLQPE
jgi:hypothetical protein